MFNFFKKTDFPATLFISASLFALVVVSFSLIALKTFFIPQLEANSITNQSDYQDCPNDPLVTCPK